MDKNKCLHHHHHHNHSTPYHAPDRLARPTPICLRNAERNGALRPTTVATPQLSQLVRAPPKSPVSPIMLPGGAPSVAPNGDPGAATQNPVPYFSPAMPIPPVISVPDTIAHLRMCLEPSHRDYWRVEQHVDIRKAIRT